MTAPHLPKFEPKPETLIEVRGLLSQFGDRTIHENLDLDVHRGEVLGVVGGSGTGKTVLLNTIIGLKEPEGGTVSGAPSSRNKAWPPGDRTVPVASSTNEPARVYRVRPSSPWTAKNPGPSRARSSAFPVSTSGPAVTSATWPATRVLWGDPSESIRSRRAVAKARSRR